MEKGIFKRNNKYVIEEFDEKPENIVLNLKIGGRADSARIVLLNGILIDYSREWEHESNLILNLTYEGKLLDKFRLVRGSENEIVNTMNRFESYSIADIIVLLEGRKDKIIQELNQLEKNKEQIHSEISSMKDEFRAFLNQTINGLSKIQ